MPQGRERQRRGLQAGLVLLVTVLALTLSGCQLPFGPQVTVSGTVYGEKIAERQSGTSVPVPLSATISCNGAVTTANSSGAFSFTVSQANTYSCTATAPNYGKVTASITSKANAFTLTFGPKQAKECSAGESATALICSVLPPAPATLRGTVTNAATDQALPHVKVSCWNSALDVTANDGSSRITATTDDLGNYVFHDVPVDPWGCVADTDHALQTTTLMPGKTATLDIPVCKSSCPEFTYHQGNVVHRLAVYLIFWLPNGYSFEPDGGSSSRFQQLMAQYFQDVGGTSFYNILSQYYDDLGGPVRNVVTLADTFLDTQPYPVAATESAPLLDGDIAHEINRVLDVKKGAWVTDAEHVVFLFTGYNVQECSGQTSADGCTFQHNSNTDFCAYHSNTFYNNLIYAYIPVVDGCLDLPTSQSPNNDPIADAIISTVSHEQFEAVSNPSLGGWFVSDSDEGEMADKCVRRYGPVGDDGSNVTLAHGHRYIVQKEWSLRDQNCVLALASPSGG